MLDAGELPDKYIVTGSNNTWSECTNSTAIGYLKTHVLFFKERYPNPANGATEFTYRGLISPDFTGSELTEDDPITIYWVWPDTFKQMMYVDGANELGGLKGIAYDSTTLEEIRQFVSDNKTVMFPSGTTDLNTNVANSCSDATTDQQKALKAASITALDTAYNAADTTIGGVIQGSLTELTAEAVAEHAVVSP